jgi:hypothetical protein
LQWPGDSRLYLHNQFPLLECSLSLLVEPYNILLTHPSYV